MRNDGAYLETAMEDYFKTIKKASFFWRRLYDTKAARNVLPAQPSDFFFSFIRKEGGSYPYHLECKSRKGKTFRLPKPSQFNAMRRWSLAGVRGLFLVHFYELDKFALASVRDLDSKAKSWVLDDHYDSIEEAFEFLKR
jgi:hypothetical protein